MKKVIVLMLSLIMLCSVFVACVDDDGGEGGNHYKDPSEQENGGEGGDNGDNSGDGSGEGENGNGEGDSEGNGIPEVETPVVPIE